MIHKNIRESSDTLEFANLTINLFSINRKYSPETGHI